MNDNDNNKENDDNNDSNIACARLPTSERCPLVGSLGSDQIRSVFILLLSALLLVIVVVVLLLLVVVVVIRSVFEISC